MANSSCGSRRTTRTSSSRQQQEQQQKKRPKPDDEAKDDTSNCNDDTTTTQVAKKIGTVLKRVNGSGGGSSNISDCIDQHHEIFLSYSRRDVDVVKKIRDELQQLSFTVWMDTNEIDGGDLWEEAIVKSIQHATIFIVVVSQDSNSSNWVRRETIRAEQLNKIRIPVLLNDELPLRLLDLQFIDFRGPFDDGFHELVQVLEKLLNRKARALAGATSTSTTTTSGPGDGEEIDLKIGAAIRELMNNNGDRTTADNLLREAITLDKDIATSPSDFWSRLATNLQQSTIQNAVKAPSTTESTNEASGAMVTRSKPTKTATSTMASKATGKQSLRIIEHSKYVDINLYKNSGDNAVLWSVELASSNDNDDDENDDGTSSSSSSLLDTIDHVLYKLHPSFRQSKQIVRDRKSNFQLKRIGWGIFTIQIQVVFLDQSVKNMDYDLTFHDAWRSPSPTPTRRK